jgi:broad-specificity NMP kinase
MKHFVLAITGPAGSGKSTVSERVAKKLERCVNIDADSIKRMIVSGFHIDTDNPDGWFFDQWALVGDSIGLLAANFIGENYRVIINGHIDETAWAHIQKHVEITHKVLLLPEIGVVVSRDAGRQGNKALGEESVTRHHKFFSTESYFKSFIKLDTANQSIEETVDSIVTIIR